MNTNGHCTAACQHGDEPRSLIVIEPAPGGVVFRYERPGLVHPSVRHTSTSVADMLAHLRPLRAERASRPGFAGILYGICVGVPLAYRDAIRSLIAEQVAAGGVVDQMSEEVR